MLKRWEKLSTETKFKNPWWTYRIDRFQIPEGPAGEYHYVQTNGASMVVPMTDDGRLVLVRQYRYLWEQESLEFPCGSVKAGHSFDQTAHLELEEETGYQAGDLRKIGAFNPCNGLTSETCQVLFRHSAKARELPTGSHRGV